MENVKCKMGSARFKVKNGKGKMQREKYGVKGE